MRLMKIVILLFVLLEVSLPVFGACTRMGATSLVNFRWGSTKVYPDLPVGEVVGESHSMTLKGGALYRLCEGNYKLTGSFVSGGKFDPITNTYPTGVKGVGIRITVSKGNESYVLGTGPVGFDIRPNSTTNNIDFEGYVIEGQLIRTSEIIEPGILSGLQGAVANLYLDGFENSTPAVSISLGEQGMSPIITSPSCSLLSHDNRNLTVRLPYVKLKSFKRIGSFDGETKVNFKLKCHGGYDNISTEIFTEFKSVSGEYGGENGIDTGVLANEAEGNQTANNIGIQVLMNGEPLTFEFPEKYGQFTGAEGGIDYNMSARYYQYGDNPSAGKVLSRMIYTLSYQ